ncbi:MAG: hypothetical protein WC840_04855 [Candidatus Peribacteraceae bacterium]
MAIKVTKQGEKMIIELDNGHAKALEKIVADYSIKGEQEALGFMLAVLSQGNGKKIEVNGTSFVPSEAIQKSATLSPNGQEG